MGTNRTKRRETARRRKQILVALVWAGLDIEDAASIVGVTPATARHYARWHPDCHEIDREIRGALVRYIVDRRIDCVFHSDTHQSDALADLRDLLAADRLIAEGQALPRPLPTGPRQGRQTYPRQTGPGSDPSAGAHSSPAPGRADAVICPGCGAEIPLDGPKAVNVTGKCGKSSPETPANKGG